MSDKKSRPKHEVISRKSNSSIVWMISTLALAILLIISIVTSGFGIVKPTVKSIVSDVNSLKGKTTDATFINALESVAKTLTPYENVAPASTISSSYSGATLTITEYSDYQCPYCKSAEDGAVATIKKNFGSAVTFDYKNFPLSFHPYAEKAAEAAECARDQGKFWEYHDKLFASQPNLDIPYLKTYAKDLGLDTTKFNACLDNGEKASLIQSQIAEGSQKGVQGTPAFFIGGQLVSGAQPYASFLPAICAQIPNHPACKNAPKPVSFNIYVIDDKRCTDCDSTRISGALSQIFAGATIQNIDYNTSRGKELYNIAGVTYLPMFILESKVKDDPGFSKIQGALTQKGDYYVILPDAVGSSFDPSGEICTNGIDDNGDGLIDCADPSCAQKLECRTAINKSVQLFIMADCPYGKQAVQALKEASDNFGANMKYEINYIATDNGDGTFSSLHGSYEADEDKVQLCAQNIAPTKYLSFVNCRATNGIKGIDYTSCANIAGIDSAAIKTCATGSQGSALLSANIKIAEALQISASPTWLANNRYEFSGIDAQTVKTNFCRYNPGTTGCDNTLTTNTQVPSGAGCGT